MVRNEEPDGRVAHFEGERGAERVVRVDGLPGGEVRHYEGERGAELLVRAWKYPPATLRGNLSEGRAWWSQRRGPGEMVHYEGEQGAERCVRVERLSGNNAVFHFEGKAGVERLVRHEWPCGGVSYFEGGRDAEVLVRRELPMGTDTLGLAFVQHFARDGGVPRPSWGCRVPLRLSRLELPYGGVVHFEGEMGASDRYWL